MSDEDTVALHVEYTNGQEAYEVSFFCIFCIFTIKISLDPHGVQVMPLAWTSTAIALVAGGASHGNAYVCALS